MSKKIGIVGGLGWRATADYYAAIHELAASSSLACAEPDLDAALEVTIESLDHSVAHSLLMDGERDGRWDGFDNYHRAALLRLERSEAEVALIACNTPHERLPAIARGTRLDVIDLFAAVCTEARRLGARRLLILGTATTMKSERFRSLLVCSGIEPIAPPVEVAERVQELIENLQEATPVDASAQLLHIVRACLATRRTGDFIGLHCTELPLAFPDRGRTGVVDVEGMRFLNASIIHVEAALRAARPFPVPDRKQECRLAD